jgi:hypothetical protein
MEGSDPYQEFEQELGVKPGFLSKILEEDHWSMIIKLHALIEASVSHILQAKLQQPKLKSIFERLELSNKSTGKLEFAKALDLLDSEQRGFIRALSVLRNYLAHDPRQTEFNLKTHMMSMNSQKRNSLKQVLGYCLIRLGRSALDIEYYTQNYPELLIFAGARDIFLSCHLQSNKSKTEMIQIQLGLLQFEFTERQARASYTSD